MSPAPPSSRPPDRWHRVRRLQVVGLVCLVGGLIHALVFIVATVPVGEGPEPVRARAVVEWSGVEGSERGSVWAEQALLLDAEPLFVPSPWNAASRLSDIARLRDETELFPPFPPRLPSENGLWSPRSERDAPDLLALDAPREPLRLFGRERPVREPTAGRSAVSLEVFSLGGDATVFAEELLDPGGEAPPATLWNPLEFLLVVDPATGGGLPLRLNSSGSPAWDRAVARELARHPAIARLPDGYFRVVVGR